MAGRVLHVSRSPSHTFSKAPVRAIRLLEGLGVEGDAHCGKTVKHRSRVAADPNQPNLRQVHLLHSELFDELAGEGFELAAGQCGENVLTRGIDLLALPRGARLDFGAEASIEITGLRNPCKQLNGVHPKLLSRLAYRDPTGMLVRLAGVMAIVGASGEIKQGDPIRVSLPPEPHIALDRV